MGALGYVMQTPEEEKYLNTKQELTNMIVMAFGGRAAEELVFGDVTTGAANDIQQATKIARAMVTQYGMSDRFGLMQLETTESMYLEQRKVMNCADTTAADVDSEVKDTLKRCYDEAKELLSGNRDILDKIAAFLIEKETITGTEFMNIYHKCLDERKEASGEAEAASEESAEAQDAVEETAENEQGTVEETVTEA